MVFQSQSDYNMISDQTFPVTAMQGVIFSTHAGHNIIIHSWLRKYKNLIVQATKLMRDYPLFRINHSSHPDIAFSRRVACTGFSLLAQLTPTGRKVTSLGSMYIYRPYESETTFRAVQLLCHSRRPGGEWFLLGTRLGLYIAAESHGPMLPTLILTVSTACQILIL